LIENLQDHVNSRFSFESIEPHVFLDLAGARKEYQDTRTGPLADNAVFTFANMPLMQFLSSEEQANLQIILEFYNKEVSLTGNALEQARFSFIRNAIQSPNQASATAFIARNRTVPGSGDYITLCAMLSHSFSTGSVHIRSSIPQNKPLIDFRYLSHPLDVHILGYHMKSLLCLAQTPPLSSLLIANGKTLPEGHSIASLPAAEKFVKECCGTNYHPCGSCAMLPKEMGGVVDEKLKVYGTTNLRIVDASVFPIIPRGNIITMVYAVAEKGADIIGLDLGIQRIS
jgi:choline dehydrogenase-like flavoprotein